jgi:hypothetical protein
MHVNIYINILAVYVLFQGFTCSIMQALFAISFLLCLVLRFLYPEIISRNLAFRVARGPEATPESAPLPKSPVFFRNGEFPASASIDAHRAPP